MKAVDRLLTRKIAWEIEAIIKKLEAITPDHPDLHLVLTHTYKELLSVRTKVRGLLDNLPSRFLTKEEKNDIRNR